MSSIFASILYPNILLKQTGLNDVMYLFENGSPDFLRDYMQRQIQRKIEKNQQTQKD